MSKSNFDGIMAGLTDALAIAKGEAAPETYRVHVPDQVDVAGIRKRLNLTQPAFSARYGFSLAAVRDWEQKRKAPEAASRVLLTVIDKEPEAVDRALAGADRGSLRLSEDMLRKEKPGRRSARADRRV